jgi:hypothetical protein
LQGQSTGQSYGRFDKFLTLFLSDQCKEENRNLGIILRDLQVQYSDSQAIVQRLEIEKERLARQLNEACDASDRHENEGQWLKNG